MSEPKQEVCDRAAIVVARMVGWVPEEKRGELAAHIRIALDTEVEAGGPYINNGWNRRALSPPEPTEGLRAAANVLAKLADDFEATAQKAMPDADVTLAVGDGANVAGSLIVRLGDCRKARAALCATPLQDHGWLDISTAPDDGSFALTFTPTRDPPIALLRYSKDRDDSPKRDKWVDERGDWYVKGPTLWHPFQAPIAVTQDKRAT